MCAWLESFPNFRLALNWLRFERCLFGMLRRMMTFLVFECRMLREVPKNLSPEEREET